MKNLARLLDRMARPSGGNGSVGGTRWLDLVAMHGLLPHIRRLIRESAEVCPGFAPPPRQQVEARMRGHTARCFALTGELLSLLDLFGSHRVSVITFKGPALAMHLYGDPAARSYGDIDLLCHQDDLPAAVTILRSYGYEAPSLSNGYPVHRGRRFGDQYRFERAGRRVELHTALGPWWYRVPFDLRALSARLDTVSIAGRSVPTLSREIILPYLAAHGTKHGWERIEWIVDFATLLQATHDLDWSRILEAAKAAGNERAVLLACRLADELMSTPLPPVVAGRLRGDRTTQGPARLAQASLVHGHPVGDGRWRIWALQLLSRERWRDRALLVAFMAFTPRPAERRLFPLPDRLYRLYHIIRPIRVVLASVGSLVRLSTAGAMQALRRSVSRRHRVGG